MLMRTGRSQRQPLHRPGPTTPSRSPTRHLAWMAFRLLTLLLIASSPAAAQDLTRAQRLEALTDQFGMPFSAASLAGRPYALFFGFTHCPDICPTTLLQMSNLLQHLGADADRVAVLFVTVDPERDTPDQLRSYLTSFDPRIRGLTGTPAQIKAAAAGWKAAYDRIDEGSGIYTIAHSAHVYLMDRSGEQQDTINFQEDEVAQLTKLRRLLASP